MPKAHYDGEIPDTLDFDGVEVKKHFYSFYASSPFKNDFKLLVLPFF